MWGAVSGLAAATGVFLGGVLSQGPAWRWVLFVNLPVCAAIVPGAYRLVPGQRRRAALANFDLPGAILATGGMLLLIYALVNAPSQGWGAGRTIGELAAAAVVLAVFVLIELRRRDPLSPFSIFRIKGLAAADATQMIAFAGFVSLFFFLTLYMQDVLGYSPIQSGSAYLPVTAGIVAAAGISSRLFARTGTRPVTVAGTLIAAAAIYYLSRVPVHGSYLTDLLRGLVVMSIGLGAVFVSVTAAANAGVPAGQSRAGGRPAQHLTTTRDRARPSGLLSHRRLTHQRPARGPQPPRRPAHRGLPPGPAGLHDLPARRRRDRAARHQHPRRTGGAARSPPESYGPMAAPELTGQDQPTPAHTPQVTPATMTAATTRQPGPTRP